MGFRIRLGPFTSGKSGSRFSVWKKRGGVSIPITGKGNTFGKVSGGIFRWFFSSKK